MTQVMRIMNSFTKFRTKKYFLLEMYKPLSHSAEKGKLYAFKGKENHSHHVPTPIVRHNI